jgi:hypothetical protein
MEISHVKTVAARSVRNDSAVLHRKGSHILINLPAGEILAIEQRGKAFVCRGQMHKGQKKEEGRVSHLAAMLLHISGAAQVNIIGPGIKRSGSI